MLEEILQHLKIVLLDVRFAKRKRNLLNVKIIWDSKFDFHFVRIKYLKEKQKIKVFIGWIRNEDEKKKLNESIHRKCVRN